MLFKGRQQKEVENLWENWGFKNNYQFFSLLGRCNSLDFLNLERVLLGKMISQGLILNGTLNGRVLVICHFYQIYLVYNLNSPIAPLFLFQQLTHILMQVTFPPHGFLCINRSQSCKLITSHTWRNGKLCRVIHNRDMQLVGEGGASHSDLLWMD